MRGLRFLVLLSAASCTVEWGADSAAQTEPLTAPGHVLLVLSFEKGAVTPYTASVASSRRVEGPLPRQRAPQHRPWRLVLTDAAGGALYETAVRRADRAHAVFHDGPDEHVTVPLDSFALMVRVPATDGAARLQLFDGEVLLAPAVEVPR